MAPVAEAQASGPFDRVMVGASLGKGAGLIGVFAAWRATERVGFEAGVGKRLFMVAAGPTSEIFWPTAVVGKLQYYFPTEGGRLQSGLEAGVTFSPDTGVGGEAAYFARLSLGGSMFVDFNLGLLFVPDVQTKGAENAASQLGGTTSSFEMKSSPVALMWKLGLGWAF